jgi:3-isopropylmalate/(R)-2-methylmalate dehydratase small subunit
VDPFTSHRGKVTPLDRVDVDTDQIIPKQFLKRIERTGYGQFLFYDWRRGEDGSPDPDFVLNRPEYQGGTVLVAGRNFGCGSSREHAPWALLDYGFRAVISTSFADIFKSNCYQNGLLPVELDNAAVAHIMKAALAGDDYEVTVDLEGQVVQDGNGWTVRFSIDPFRRDCLLNGLDEIALTLTLESEIQAFEDAAGYAILGSDPPQAL